MQNQSMNYFGLYIVNLKLKNWLKFLKRSLYVIVKVRMCDVVFQGEMRYMLVGDYPAQDFFSIHPQNSQLRVVKNLKADSLRSAKYVVSILHHFKV